MNWEKIIGIFLIAGVLMAGSAMAEGNPDEALGTPDSGQVSGPNEMAIPSEVPLSGQSDGASSEKELVPMVEDAPKAEAVPGAEVAPKAEDVPKAEDAPKVEDAPGVEPVPESEVVPDKSEAGDAGEEVTIADPIEPWNRAMFQFNDKLYFWALKPVARGYNAVVPEPVRVSVRNFFRNAAMPVRFVSSLLQGKLEGAGIELARFGVNTTVGLAGFLDVAKIAFNLDAQNEDLGQTLGWYGMPGTMYIVWPFLGPSTVRDTLGYAGDLFLDPFNYISPFEVPLGVHVYDRINNTSLDLGNYEDMKKSALEPYISMRDAYIQYRKGLINK